jgi:phospholipase/carboxylesterase
MSELVFLVRPARSRARGLLVLHHGRGTDERDLLALADLLDPQASLEVVTPRAPLVVAGAPGYHWYRVPRVGTPDPVTFADSHAKLASLHDELWAGSGISPRRTVLGGFSMGAVMSYALGLDRERPPPAGILAFSGFLPSVPGWEPDLAGRRGMPVLITHGRRDPVIAVDFGREVARRLTEGGLRVEYEETEGSHRIEPAQLQAASRWLAPTLGDPARAAGSA